MTRPAQLRYPTVWLPVPIAWLRARAGTDEVAAVTCGFEDLRLVLRDGSAVDLLTGRRALRRLVGIVAPVIRIRAPVRAGPLLLVPIESHVRGALYAVDAILALR